MKSLQTSSIVRFVICFRAMRLALGNALLSYGLTQVCHVDTSEVMLIYEQRSFGLTIDAPPGRSVGSAGMLMEPPIITHIEPRGPAERYVPQK